MKGEFLLENSKILLVIHYRFLLGIMLILLIIIGVESYFVYRQSKREVISISMWNKHWVGIVYILPSNASTPYWFDTYGDRIYFYVYANLSTNTTLQNYIKNDFKIISKVFQFIVIVIPVPLNWNQFLENLKIINDIASKYNLKILWAIFPKSNYGPEYSYLIPHSSLYNKTVQLMDFLTTLSSTWRIAIWYGWTYKNDPSKDIPSFYASLPERLRKIYTPWFDSPFVSAAVKERFPQVANELNLTVITELYSPSQIEKYGNAFKNQIIVTGYPGARSSRQWVNSILHLLSYLHYNSSVLPRYLIIWIYWDHNDGSGQDYTAYINGTLLNPLQ